MIMRSSSFRYSSRIRFPIRSKVFIVMENETKCNIKSDIKGMLFGLGDTRHSLDETVCVMESFLAWQFRIILFKLDEWSVDEDKITHLHFVYLLKNHTNVLQRLIDYIRLKDGKFVLEQGILSTLEVDDLDELDLDTVNKSIKLAASVRNRADQCVALANEIGLKIMGESTAGKSDPVKEERQTRTNMIAQFMEPEIHAEYVVSCQKSFNERSKQHRLLEWLWSLDKNFSNGKVKATCYDMFAFLAKELLAQMMDTIYLLRMDQLRGKIHDSCLFNRTLEKFRETPVAPEEVQEVIRRHRSVLLKPFAMFDASYKDTNDKLFLS